MSVKPAHDHEIDGLTEELLGAVDELQAQLEGHVPAQLVKLKVAVVRDVADHLHAAIEDSLKATSAIVKQSSSAD